MKSFWSKTLKRMNWAWRTKYAKLHIKCACRSILKKYTIPIYFSMATMDQKAFILIDNVLVRNNLL